MSDLPKHKMTAEEFLAWAEELPCEASSSSRMAKWSSGSAQALRSAWSTGMRRAAYLPRCAQRSSALACRDAPLSSPHGVALSQHDGSAKRAAVPRVSRNMQEVPHPLILIEVPLPTTKTGLRCQAAGLLCSAQPGPPPDRRPGPGAADPPQARS